MIRLSDPLPEPYDDLREVAESLLAANRRQAVALKAKTFEIEALKFELARLKRWRFGASAERFHPDPLGLFEEDLETDLAAVETRQALAEVALPGKTPRHRPKRQILPAHLPRIEHRHALESCACGHCGHELTVIGEAISEQLVLIPAQFFVHRHIRPQYACRHCDTVTAVPMPPQVIDKGLPAPGLLAHILVSKYADHQPLYRQAVMYARQGVFIPRSTQAGWVGASEVLLEPLVERLRVHLLAETYLQADETRLPVLAPGTGKTRTGYLWVYRTGSWSSAPGGGIRLRRGARPDLAGGVPGWFQRHATDRRLRRLQRRAGVAGYRRGRLLGSRAARVLRRVQGHPLAGGCRGAAADSDAV